jgi:biofilm PGA synthesis N-glycosyltransferase PgaC
MESSRQNDSTIRYIIVSPVRDEAQYLDTTIRCIVNQTIRPVQYILVDDGSTDDTLNIMHRWAAQYPWIVPVHRSDSNPGKSEETQENSRGKRARAAKEILAFYEGFHGFAISDWDFLVKLDGDVGLEPNYFERCFQEFERDPKLGIGGGVICHIEEGHAVVERQPDFHVRGATKIYRDTCWKAIGGVSSGAAWDSLDELKANMLGWSTRSFPQLQVLHYRYTGAANGTWQNAVKKGEWNYISGYHPLFMACKILRNVIKKPWLSGAAGLLYGYLRAFFLRAPQVEDRPLIRYIRDQQLRRLCYLSTIWR